jgi:iron(III) transport system substrate-binding protein
MRSCGNDLGLAADASINRNMKWEERMRSDGAIRSFLLVFAAMVTSTNGPAVGQGAAAGDNPAIYRGADREQRLLDGARKEGQVTVYSSMIADQALRPILNGFQAKYPFVKAQYVRDDPPQQLQKVMAEARAGRVVVDVLESTGLEVPVRAAGINQSFWSPESEAYPTEHRDPEGYWAPTRFSYLGACYNTNLLKAGEQPKSFQDFLDPKWKGKIAWSSTVIGAMLFITGVRNFMGEEKALAYLRELAKQDIAPIASANRVVVDRVMAGEYALCLDSFLHHPIISARKGAPVAPLPLDPVLTVVSSVMLPKAPPHPHAAVLFIDYLLSKDGQEKLQGADYFPAHPAVPPSADLDKIVPQKIALNENFISPAKMNADLARSRSIYQELFAK